MLSVGISDYVFLHDIIIEYIGMRFILCVVFACSVGNRAECTGAVSNV